MIIVPQQQVQNTPGLVNNDLCTFEIFPHSVKMARNFKKDLEMFKRKRARYSISNIKLPEMKLQEDKFQPLKNREPILNSASLKFDSAQAKAESARWAQQVKADQDLN